MRKCGFKGPLYAATALLLAASLMAAGCRKASEEKGGGVRSTLLNKGDAAPSFKMKTLASAEFSLAGPRGGLLVLNFFASWCAPCREDATGLQKTYSAFKGGGVEFIGVAVQDSMEGASKYVKEFNIAFPVGVDSSGEIASAYRIYGLPRTFVIGRDGNIIFMHTGALAEEELTMELNGLL